MRNVVFSLDVGYTMNLCSLCGFFVEAKLSQLRALHTAAELTNAPSQEQSTPDKLILVFLSHLL